MRLTGLVSSEVDEIVPQALGPLGFEGAQHRQTLRPSSSRDPQQSPVSFRIAVEDLEDPAVQCRWLAVSGYHQQCDVNYREIRRDMRYWLS